MPTIPVKYQMIPASADVRWKILKFFEGYDGVGKNFLSVLQFWDDWKSKPKVADEILLHKGHQSWDGWKSKSDCRIEISLHKGHQPLDR